MASYKWSPVAALLLVLVLVLMFVLSVKPVQMSGFNIALVGAALVELSILATKLAKRAVGHRNGKHVPVLPAT